VGTPGGRAGGWGVAAALLAVACGGGRFPPGWLYVSAVTPTAATVVWTGAEADHARCRSARGAAVDAAATAGARGVVTARLAGLLPSTVYACRAGGRRFRFRTAPGGDEPFTFAAVGDTGDGSDRAALLARRILAGRPAFLIHLGDMAYGSRAPSTLGARFFRPYGRLLARVPLFPTPGNHDLPRGAPYRDLFAPIADDGASGGPHYAFAWGAAHFASVASTEFSDAAGPRPGWLVHDLAGAAARPWRIVFLHEPPFSAGTKRVEPGLRRNLEPVVEHGRVDLLLTGHSHLYEHALPACTVDPEARVLEIVSGGGGRNLDPEPAAGHPSFVRVLAATHYVRVRVAPDAIDVRAVDVDGHVLDHVRRRHGQPLPCRAEGWPEPRAR
jgi:calcineurin-like phosphoesterase family protein